MVSICCGSPRKPGDQRVTRHFCTYFDHRYFDRGMAMHDSLLRHCPQARLWVLCLSDACHQALTKLALPSIVPIRLADFEENNEALAAAKRNRSLIEYYFTCTASLMDWILTRENEIEVLTYLDGDLYFFSDPDPLFGAFEGHSSLLIENRFSRQLEQLAVYGRYNVGWISFRRDSDGMAALRWWRDRCLEWCYDRLEGDRFADQKYLDLFPTLFRGVLVLDHPGANLAPWNMGRHRLTKEGDCLRVDGQPLIFYHFHNFKRILPFVWRTYHRENFVPRYSFLARLLYRPYVRALIQSRRLGASVGLKRQNMLKRGYRGYGWAKNFAKMIIFRDFVIGP